MKTFWRLRKKDYRQVAFDLKRVLPELKKMDADDIAGHLRGSGIVFYQTEKVTCPFFVRVTLPVALLTMTILLLFLPVNFVITGYWGYKFERLNNWFRSLGF